MTGYITNIIAVKMLFRKYLGFGGVILATRADFETNFSKLVERDIINHCTLEDELGKQEFIQVVNTIVSDWLQIYLYQNSPKTSLGQIPGVPKAMENFLAFVANYQSEIIGHVLEAVAAEITIAQLGGEKQLNYLANKLIEACLEVARDNQLLEGLVIELHSEIGSSPLKDYIPIKLFQSVASNFQMETKDFHVTLATEFGNEVRSVTESLYNGLGIRDILHELELSVKEKTLERVLGSQNVENLSNNLMSRMVKFLNTPEGRVLLNNTSSGLFEILKGIELPLLELFRPQSASSIESLLVEKLPSAIEKVILWLRQNKGCLEKLIEQAVEETLAADSGLKANLKDFVFGLQLKSELESKFGVIAKLIKAIETDENLHTLSENTSAEILAYFKKTNVGDIIQTLENNQVLKTDDLSHLISSNLSVVAEKIDLAAFDTYFGAKVGRFLSHPVAEQLAEVIRNGVLGKLQTDLLFAPPLTQTLHQGIKTLMEKVAAEQVGKLLPSVQMRESAATMEKVILSTLSTNQGQLANFLTDQ